MKVTHEQGDPRSLTLLEENARFMPYDRFQRLVTQIKDDGVLQQWPFVWNDQKSGKRIVLSGNHRVKAAIEAGLETVDWTECDEDLTRDEQVRIQLSHNAVVGEDDPEVLRRLYESIDDVEERLRTGLDDDVLGLLNDSSTESLSEVNLDFMTLSVVFLPNEYDRAFEALQEATKMVSADETWIAKDDQHGRTLAALEAARESAHVMNAATGFGLLLDVWERHRTDLRHNWLDDETYQPLGSDKDSVPVASILGHAIRADDAARVTKVVDKIIARGEAKTPGEALIVLSDRYADGGK